MEYRVKSKEYIYMRVRSNFRLIFCRFAFNLQRKPILPPWVGAKTARFALAASRARSRGGAISSTWSGSARGCPRGAGSLTNPCLLRGRGLAALEAVGLLDAESLPQAASPLKWVSGRELAVALAR